MLALRVLVPVPKYLSSLLWFCPGMPVRLSTYLTSFSGTQRKCSALPLPMQWHTMLNDQPAISAPYSPSCNLIYIWLRYTCN
ncbi:MAG: hypothetical protein IPL74_08165 [Bacteroidetes bacterium]|nr:hypothetical protein [Bacteroidota bacterium]